MFVFDTDHLVILQRQSPSAYDSLLQQIGQYAPVDFFVSIISFHEQVMGWNAYISQAKDPRVTVRGYERLQKVLSNFSRAQVLPFDDPSAIIFDDLRKRRIRIGTMDLRIAAIALSRDMTVLTRNVRDFSRVPGLKVEDWTAPA